MGKVIKKSGSADFAKGGSGHMFGKGGADPAPAGQSAPTTKPGPGAKWPEGGSGHMFGKGRANAAEAGQSSKSSQ